jgi:protein-S-isoprenylcysteine O-methyltransferase Ste14
MRVVPWILPVFAVSELLLVIYGARAAHEGAGVLRIIGACIIVFAVSIVAIARYQLGDAFSVKPKAQKLVTTGLYARIRNPIYVASPFFFLGLALTLAKWWPLVIGVVVIPVQIARARKEEYVLRKAFGEQYDRYRAQTWF